jgi:hypothetical protein
MGRDFILELVDLRLICRHKGNDNDGDYGTQPSAGRIMHLPVLKDGRMAYGIQIKKQLFGMAVVGQG